MRICFPVIQDEGMDSQIYGHFASAPQFLIVDTETGDTSAVPNCDHLDPDAGCNPYKALVTQQISGIIAAGISDGFLEIFDMMCVGVFYAESDSVRENVELFKQKALQQAEMMNSVEAGRCPGVGEKHSCSHSHEDGHGCDSVH